MSFQDRWSWDDAREEWQDKIQDDFPKVWNVIWGSRQSYGDDMGGFLCFMGVRLLKMHRVLKPTGSMYLHCDPTANHYLKELMDAVFDRDNFRNEIIWSYRRWTAGEKNFQKMHDIILRYCKSGEYTFNVQYEPYGDWIKTDYGYVDEMTGKRWRWHTVKGKRYKVYLEDENRGVKLNDIWPITYLGSTAKERTGYPTQKPLALYERIIRASSNEGDMVLYPFCGCATTCVAAEKLNRQWIGIDIWEKAHEIVIDRLRKEGRVAGPKAHKRDALAMAGVQITDVDEPLKRTDNGQDAAPYLKTVERTKTERESKMSRDGMKRMLVQRHGLVCQDCYRKFDHESYFELDHRNPRSERGSNDIGNRILLCGPCNRTKSDRLTLKGLRGYNKKTDFMTENLNIIHSNRYGVVTVSSAVGTSSLNDYGGLLRVS